MDTIVNLGNDKKNNLKINDGSNDTFILNNQKNYKKS
jgi:hypothetical protein